jgi:hypothetical protein
MPEQTNGRAPHLRPERVPELHQRVLPTPRTRTPAHARARARPGPRAPCAARKRNASPTAGKASSEALRFERRVLISTGGGTGRVRLVRGVGRRVSDRHGGWDEACPISRGGEEGKRCACRPSHSAPGMESTTLAKALRIAKSLSSIASTAGCRTCAQSRVSLHRRQLRGLPVAAADRVFPDGRGPGPRCPPPPHPPTPTFPPTARSTVCPLLRDIRQAGGQASLDGDATVLALEPSAVHLHGPAAGPLSSPPAVDCALRAARAAHLRNGARAERLLLHLVENLRTMARGALRDGHRSFGVITKAGAENGAGAGCGADLGEVVDAVRLPELLFGVRPRVVGHRTGTRRVQLVRGDGRDVSTLYGWLGTELRPRAQNGSALHASPHGAVFFLSWKGAASRKGALPGRAGPQGGGGGGAGGGPVCLFRSHPALSSLVVVWRGGGGAGGAGPRGNECTVGTRVGATVGGGGGRGRGTYAGRRARCTSPAETCPGASPPTARAPRGVTARGGCAPEPFGPFAVKSAG